MIDFGPSRDLFLRVEQNAQGNHHHHDQYYKGNLTKINGRNMPPLSPIEKYSFDGPMTESLPPLSASEQEQATTSGNVQRELKNKKRDKFSFKKIFFFLARVATAELFLSIDNPYTVREGLLFNFETVITFHKKDQHVRGPATVMAFYNPDQVELFLSKLERKLSEALTPQQARCNGNRMAIMPGQPQC